METFAQLVSQDRQGGGNTTLAQITMTVAAQHRVTLPPVDWKRRALAVKPPPSANLVPIQGTLDAIVTTSPVSYLRPKWMP